jgi:hypothetical protein
MSLSRLAIVAYRRDEFNQTTALFEDDIAVFRACTARGYGLRFCLGRGTLAATRVRYRGSAERQAGVSVSFRRTVRRRH